jgi:hypothetical protein
MWSHGVGRPTPCSGCSPSPTPTAFEGHFRGFTWPACEAAAISQRDLGHWPPPVAVAILKAVTSVPSGAAAQRRSPATLSDEERRVLTDIGCRLTDEDPHLARLLGSRGHDHRHFAVWLCAMSLTTLLIGALTVQPLVCVAAWLGLLTAWLVTFTPPAE